MGKVFTLAIGLFQYATWVVFGLIALVFLAFIWSEFWGFMMKRILGFFSDSYQNKRIAKITAVSGSFIITALCISYGCSFCIVGYQDGKFWFYIYAAILLVFVPAFVSLFLQEWFERRIRRKEMERAERELEQMKENEKEMRRKLKEKRGK